MANINNLKFSVLMPIYIKEEPQFLTESLNSILKTQTVIPSELVIVEDGPLTAELNEVLDNYYEQYPEIIKRLKLETNMGMGYAMNYGLNKCSHEWVFRMDSDDIAITKRFEKQLAVIKLNEYDVIGSATEEFNDCIGDLDQYRRMPQKHTDIISFMKFRNPINHMTVAFKKEMALNAGGYWEKRYFEDYNLWYEMFKAGAKFYNIQEVLVNARIGNNMVERRSGYEYFQYENELMKKFFRDKFINILEYRFITSIKLMLRILPVNVLSFIYQKMLRKSK
jgi:glycosyltransferase involved in cell wall biosynthesis